MKLNKDTRNETIEIAQAETCREDGDQRVPVDAKDELDEHLLEMLADGEAAFEEVRPMLLAIDPSEIKKIRLDTRYAADTALGAVPRIEPFREQITALPGTDVSDLDLLRKLAGALQWIRSRMSTASCSDLRKLAEASFAHRSKLVVAAQPLVEAELIDPGRIRPVSRSRAYRQVADDLFALAGAYDDAWPKVDGKTTVTKEDVHKAEDFHHRMVAGLVSRDADRTYSEALGSEQMPARALVLLQGCYRRLRKALNYLCESESEAAAIMPSLRNRPRKQKAAKAKQAAADAAAADAAAAADQPAPVVAPAPVGGVPASSNAEVPAE